MSLVPQISAPLAVTVQVKPLKAVEPVAPGLPISAAVHPAGKPVGVAVGVAVDVDVGVAVGGTGVFVGVAVGGTGVFVGAVSYTHLTLPTNREV